MFGVCFFSCGDTLLNCTAKEEKNIYLKLIDIMGDNYNLFSQFFKVIFVFSHKNHPIRN